MNKISWRLVPYLTALLVGVIAGTFANSPRVAGLAALSFSSIWVFVDRRLDRHS